MTIHCWFVQHDDKAHNLTSTILIATNMILKKHSRDMSAKLFYEILASKFSTKLDLSGFLAEIRRDDGVQPFLFRSII